MKCDNNNQMITLTVVVMYYLCALSEYGDLDYNKRLNLLAVIQLQDAVSSLHGGEKVVGILSET